MYRSIGCLVAAVLFAAPAFAQDQGTAASTPATTSTPANPAVAAAVAQATPAPAVPKEDPVVCRSQAVTGSRLGTQRVCARQSEWDRRSQHDRQQLDKIQSTGNFTSGGG